MADQDGSIPDPERPATAEEPASPDETTVRGVDVDLALGVTFRSPLEPSGPMSSYTEEATHPKDAARAGRFAKLAVRSAADAPPPAETAEEEQLA
jgi:hypothetical protein